MEARVEWMIIFAPFGALSTFWWAWCFWSLCVGSFISMFVYRYPVMLDAWCRGAEPPFSLSVPGSFCPSCNKPLSWFRNIPVLGFFVSRIWPCCEHSVSFRYLALELSALAWGLLAWVTHQGSTVDIWGWSVFGWVLLAAGVLDYRTQWLPNVLTLGLLWSGLLHAAADLSGEGLASRVFAVVATYVLVKGATAVYEKLRKVQGALGEGDVMLVCALAAWLEPFALAYVWVGACSIQVAAMLARKQIKAAFGPALSVAGAAVAVLYW